MLNVIIRVSIFKHVKFGKEIQLHVYPKMANTLYFLQDFSMTSFCTMSNYVFSLGQQTLCKNTFLLYKKTEIMCN